MNRTQLDPERGERKGKGNESKGIIVKDEKSKGKPFRRQQVN